jgi:hypothetical protein
MWFSKWSIKNYTCTNCQDLSMCLNHLISMNRSRFTWETVLCILCTYADNVTWNMCSVLLSQDFIHKIAFGFQDT